MEVRGTQVFAAVAAVLTLLAGMAAAMTTVTAQGAATPAASDTPGEEVAYSARINAGSCDALGEVAFELDPVIRTDDAGTPAAPAGGAADASPAAETDEVGGEVAESTTEVGASLEELVAEERVITVYEGTYGNADNYFACAEITGSPASGALQINLLDDSEFGVSAVAMLLSGRDDADSTTVTILITEGDIDTRETPEATPAS